MESGLGYMFCSVLHSQPNTVQVLLRSLSTAVRLPRRDGANTTERVAASDRVAVAGQRVSTSRAAATIIAIYLRGLACACSFLVNLTSAILHSCHMPYTWAPSQGGGWRSVEVNHSTDRQGEDPVPGTMQSHASFWYRQVPNRAHARHSWAFDFSRPHARSGWGCMAATTAHMCVSGSTSAMTNAAPR